MSPTPIVPVHDEHIVQVQIHSGQPGMVASDVSHAATFGTFGQSQTISSTLIDFLRSSERMRGIFNMPVPLPLQTLDTRQMPTRQRSFRLAV